MDRLTEKVKENIFQLLNIGLYNTDEQIDKHFGNEIGLLAVINGYCDLLERINKLAEMESGE